MCFWNIDNYTHCILWRSCPASLPPVHLPPRGQAAHVPCPVSSWPSPECLTGGQGPRGSGPSAIPPFLGFTLRVPAAPNSPWLPEHGFLCFAFVLVAFFVMHLSVFQDLWLTPSAGATPLLESSPGPLGYCISVVPPSRTFSHTHCSGGYSVIKLAFLLRRAEHVPEPSPRRPRQPSEVPGMWKETRNRVWYWTVDSCSPQAGLSGIKDSVTKSQGPTYISCFLPVSCVVRSEPQASEMPVLPFSASDRPASTYSWEYFMGTQPRPLTYYYLWMFSSCW